MADTRWLLQQRGYRVVSDQDMRSPSYVYNHGLLPTAGDIRRLRILAILEADAVVLHDSTPRRDRRMHLFLCRIADIPVVLYHQLPAECPYVDRQHQVIASLDLLSRDRSLAGRLAELRVRLTYWKVRLREGCLSLLPTSLERRFRRRRSRLYPVPADHITTP